MTATTHVHLDPLGGLAGDMFLAALLDIWPEHLDGLVEAVAAAGLPPTCSVRLEAHADHALSGARFLIDTGGTEPSKPAGAYRDVRRRVRAARLAAPVRDRAIAILDLLAAAEGSVHGVPTDDVVFHELAGWDSIADVVGAAYLIDRLAVASWSTAPLPVGSGRVATAHGPLPVPAPATVKLLDGLPLIDDGIAGERVTPSGAAILRHLAVADGLPAGPLRLTGTGIGFGSRTLPGISNVVRVLAFAPAAASDARHERVAAISFEVDDQSPEDLAVGLEVLRAHRGVLDVVQMPVFGKKGRIMIGVRLLCRPEALESVADACFEETTTIGLRWTLTERRVLARASETAAADTLAVKVVRRPSGRRTAKADIDTVRQVSRGADDRRRRRTAAEQTVLEGHEND